MVARLMPSRCVSPVEKLAQARPHVRRSATGEQRPRHLDVLARAAEDSVKEGRVPPEAGCIYVGSGMHVGSGRMRPVRRRAIGQGADVLDAWYVQMRPFGESARYRCHNLPSVRAPVIRLSRAKKL